MTDDDIIMDQVDSGREVKKQSYLEYVVKTEIKTPNRLNTQTKNKRRTFNPSKYH